MLIVLNADVAKLVDAHASGACPGNGMEVRFFSSAPVKLSEKYYSPRSYVEGYSNLRFIARSGEAILVFAVVQNLIQEVPNLPPIVAAEKIVQVVFSLFLLEVYISLLEGRIGSKIKKIDDKRQQLRKQLVFAENELALNKRWRPLRWIKVEQIFNENYVVSQAGEIFPLIPDKDQPDL